MEYVNYYITILVLSLSLHKCPAITNTRPSDGSSIPKDFKRHIGLAPDTNWEPGLREATHQALLKEHVTLNHLREKIMEAPMSGQGAKVSPFGDVAILARGQLFANSNGFRYVQEPHPNDCIDCHELRQCYGKECEIYLHNGLGERLIALWTVKRLRHRNPEVHYELEYSISPIRKHVWVTRNGGYDYSIPGHVFVVKTGHSQSNGFHQNGYIGDHNQKVDHNKYPELPHYPHPAVPPKVHSNKHPLGGNRPANTGQWVQVNQPPLLPPPRIDKLPNYYLPQKPGDQTASTSQKDVQPTLDYAEIEAYKNLLQVLHQKTSTTEQRQKPTKVTQPTNATTPIKEMSSSTAMLPTRPPLSHTMWLLPSTTTKTTRPPTHSTRPSSAITTTQSSTSPTSERPRTTKIIETTTTSIFTRPPTSSPTYITKPSFSTTQSGPGTTFSFRPTVIQAQSTTSPRQSTTSIQQSTRPQTIYQQLGGFDSSKPQSSSATPAMTTVTQRRPVSTTSHATYPIKTTIPMTHPPTQPSLISSSFSQDTTKQREMTKPMTTTTITFSTHKRPTPTKPMTTPQLSQSTKPLTTSGLTRPTDGQTTSTFLFSTKVTPPFGLGVTKPIGTTQSQNTLSTFYGKPGFSTIFQTTFGQTQTTQPVRFPTTSTLPGSTHPATTYQTTYYGVDTTIPARTTIPGLTAPTRGTDQSGTTLVRGTEPGTTYISTSGTSTRYPTTQYLPSTTSEFNRPTTIFTDGTSGTTVDGHKTTIVGTTNLPTSGTPTRPTGLLETTKETYPTTNGYQRPIPTFFIDPTHPGYPKTTPTTPFTDGQAFKPSQPDPVHHHLPPLTKPPTTFTPPTTSTTLTDFINTDTNGNTIFTVGGHTTTTTEGGSTSTFLVPSTTNRYTPPSTAHSHTISIPTKLPKPSTPFKVPAIDDYDVDLFPRDPNAIKTTTSTTTTTPIPTGDFILPEEHYKPQPLVPELNQDEVDVFDKLPPLSSTTVGPTTTINPVEIKEVFDSATFKPKPPIDESVFDEFFKQDNPTTTIANLNDVLPKVIYSDFFEASTVPPTRVLEAFSTIPSTSQSFSTSVSFEVNNGNKVQDNLNGNSNTKAKLGKKLKFRKAKVKEVALPDNEYKVYRAEHPEPSQEPQNHDLVGNIEVTNNGNLPAVAPGRKYGPLGRKYKNKSKPTTTASTGITKAFDDLALQLVNHARTIDYLEGKPTESVAEKIKPKAHRVDATTGKTSTSSNTNLQNRNKYKRKSYGRVRKVKKRPENKATITRTNRGAINARNSTSPSTKTNSPIQLKKKVEEIA